MPVKIEPHIVENLALLDLVLWEAKHPRQNFYNEKTGKMSTRENKGWVLIGIAGPGVDGVKPAGGPTLAAAVDSALRVYFSDRVPGVRGAMLRLEEAVFGLTVQMKWSMGQFSGEYDDDIPF